MFWGEYIVSFGALKHGVREEANGSFRKSLALFGPRSVMTKMEKKEHRFAEIFRLQQLPLKMTEWDVGRGKEGESVRGGLL